MSSPYRTIRSSIPLATPTKVQNLEYLAMWPKLWWIDPKSVWGFFPVLHRWVHHYVAGIEFFCEYYRQGFHLPPTTQCDESRYNNRFDRTLLYHNSPWMTIALLPAMCISYDMSLSTQEIPRFYYKLNTWQEWWWYSVFTSHCSSNSFREM